MSEDVVVIEATHGPYAGKRLTVSEADAKAAIKDGWAVDPFAEKPTEPVEVKEVSDEDRQKIIEAANKAAAKLRGETTDDSDGKKTRAMEAEDPAEYQTKSSGCQEQEVTIGDTVRGLLGWPRRSLESGTPGVEGQPKQGPWLHHHRPAAGLAAGRMGLP